MVFGLNPPLVKSGFEKVIFTNFQNAPYFLIFLDALKISPLVKRDFFVEGGGI